MTDSTAPSAQHGGLFVGGLAMSISKPVPLALALLCFGAMGSSAQAQSTAPDLATLTASDAVQQLCAGTLSSEQLVAAYLAQAKAGANLNAFITLDEAG